MGYTEKGHHRDQMEGIQLLSASAEARDQIDELSR